MKYKFKDGKEINMEEISISEKDRGEIFKVNLPDTEENFKTGNGEGMWACTSNEYRDKIENSCGEIAFVRLLNTSCYYPGLNYGALIAVETRGKLYRPVALYDELNASYKKITQKEKDELMNKIYNAYNNH